MSSRISICLFILLTGLQNLSAQSFNHFKFKGQVAKDSTTYQSFFVKFKDGSGFMRVSYTAPDTKETMIVELKMQEQYVLNAAGMPNNKFLFYKSTGTEIIAGKTDLKYQPCLFWYKINSATLTLEPWAVSTEAVKILPAKNNLVESKLLKSVELEKNFVKNYFLESEDFYKALFDVRTKNVTAAGRTVRMHVICVANTNEKVIGASCKNDMNRALLLFNTISEVLGLDEEPIIKTISGDKYSLKAVENEIKKLDPDPNDIVVFYYSGHGFRKDEDKRPYPYIDLRSKTDTARKSYLVNSKNIEDIQTEIIKKGARFNLVISDCCNSLVTETNKTGDPISETKDAGLDFSEDNCKTLFLNPTPQSILITAAKEKQLATSNNTFGGFFSYFFKAAVEDHLSPLKKNITWQQIIDQASAKTTEKAQRTYCSKPYIRKNICNQEPVAGIKIIKK